MDLVDSNHWAEKTRGLPYADQSTHYFPFWYNITLILSPLYVHLMSMYYDIYLVEMDVFDFTAVVYQAEIIMHLAINPEMG